MESTFDKQEYIDSKYKILFCLENNANFELYRAKDKMEKTCLIALYNSSKIHRHSFANESLFEAEILKKVHHENIITYVDSGEIFKNNCKYHYLVSEFVSGESLKEKIARDGPFSQFSAVSLILKIAKAIEVLHNHNPTIVHNNLNMQNIVLDYTKETVHPIITNFQCSRYLQDVNQSINIKLLNPFYIAPELYNGVYTVQSDIFSLGAMLYHMIFGIPPWHLDNPTNEYFQPEFVDALFEKREERLRFLLPSGDKLEDESLKDTLSKALHQDVDQRFNTLSSFLDALHNPVRIEEGNAKGSISNSAGVRKKPKKGEGFSAIAGMTDLKDLFDTDVIRALNEPELYKSYGLTIPNGMLLYGPPGCGKTFISQQFAEEVGFNFVELKPSDIKSQFINATEDNIGKIFKDASDNAPSIVFIDEIDAVVPSREDSNLHQMHAAPVNEFLAQMSNCSERGIFVIAATNRPERIDPAILRTGRLDKIIYLPPPDFDARLEMFKLYLKDRPVELDFDYELIATKTENYVSSDLKFLIDESSRVALGEKARISTEHVLNTIKTNKPSVSHSELKKYEELKKKIEDDKAEPAKKPMGFIQ